MFYNYVGRLSTYAEYHAAWEVSSDLTMQHTPNRTENQSQNCPGLK